jgi:dynein heavy chain
MFQNVITNAFEGAATTNAGVELLESFSSLARRDSILRCVEKKSAEVHDKFIQEMGLVKNTFDKLKVRARVRVRVRVRVRARVRVRLESSAS